MTNPLPVNTLQPAVPYPAANPMPSRDSFPSNGQRLPPSILSPPQKTEVTSYLCHTIIESIYNSKFPIFHLELDHMKGQCALMV